MVEGQSMGQLSSKHSGARAWKHATRSATAAAGKRSYNAVISWQNRRSMLAGHRRRGTWRNSVDRFTPPGCWLLASTSGLPSGSTSLPVGLSETATPILNRFSSAALAASRSLVDFGRVGCSRTLRDGCGPRIPMKADNHGNPTAIYGPAYW